MDSQVLDLFAIFFLQNISYKLDNKENKFGAKKNTSSGKKLDSVGLKKQPRNEAQILHQAVAKISYRLFPGIGSGANPAKKSYFKSFDINLDDELQVIDKHVFCSRTFF